jgi:DNA-binding LytR/AlgR family response regulator
MFNKLIKRIIRDKLSLTCNEIQAEELVNCIMSEIDKNKFIQFLDEKNSLIWVSIEDVFYIYEKQKNIYAFVTLNQEYELLNKNIDISAIITEDFYQLDKKTVVNIKSVKWYDSYMGIIYFSDDTNEKDAKKLRVAIKSIDIVKRKLGKEKDKSFIKNSSDIYCPSAVRY